MKRLMILACALFGLATVVEATNVSGIITTTTWTKANSPYRVTNLIRVATGNTLAINPGVDILFDADVPFLVEGSLRALGTEGDSVRFLKGMASEWGGLRISNGDSSTLRYVRISDGHAEGNGEEGYGGGLYVANSDTRVGLIDCMLSNNRCDRGGGGSALHVNEGAVTITNVIMQSNYSSTPPKAALFIRIGRLRMKRSAIVNNSSDGIIIVSNYGAIIDSCSISHNAGHGVNITSYSGQVVLNRSLIIGNTGAGINAEALTNATIKQCTISRNDGGIVMPNCSNYVTLDHCILWGNRQEIADEFCSYLTATYSDIRGGWPGEGNIDADPLFVDSEKNDFRLTSNSPCIDFGNLYNPRDPDGTIPDLGAYFYDQGTPPPPPPPSSSKEFRLPEMGAIPGGVALVPIRGTASGAYGFDLAFVIDTTIIVPDTAFVRSHAFDFQPSALADWHISGDTVKVSLAADLLQSVTLDSEIVATLAFRVKDVSMGSVSPLVWLPFPLTNVNEEEAALTDGALTAVMYGDVSDDREISALDASFILRYVVGAIPSINFAAADVTGNGFVSSFDAAWVLYRVVYPDYRFPIEGGALPRLPRPAGRTISWVREGAVWALVIDDPTGIVAGDFSIAVPEGAIIEAPCGTLASRWDNGVLHVAVARLDEDRVLFEMRNTGLADFPPRVIGAVVNEEEVAIVRTAVRNGLSLSPNFPNPFNPSTAIRFTLSASGSVTLGIYDANGQLVRTLVDDTLPAGSHEAAWDGRNSLGRPVGSGVYFYRLTANEGVRVRKMVLAR